MSILLLKPSLKLIKTKLSLITTYLVNELLDKDPGITKYITRNQLNNREKTLINSLTLIVESLENEELIESRINELELNYLIHIIIPKYHKLIGEILLEAFEKYLREEWTKTLDYAWTDAYKKMVILILKQINKNNHIPNSQLFIIQPKEDIFSLEQKKNIKREFYKNWKTCENEMIKMKGLDRLSGSRQPLFIVLSQILNQTGILEEISQKFDLENLDKFCNSLELKCPTCGSKLTTNKLVGKYLGDDEFWHTFDNLPSSKS